MYFRKYLLKLRAIKFCFRWNKYYAQPPWITKLFDWNACSSVYLKRNQADLLINKESCLSEKNQLQIKNEFFKMAT